MQNIFNRELFQKFAKVFSFYYNVYRAVFKKKKKKKKKNKKKKN
jgi:hypothetical protein